MKLKKLKRPELLAVAEGAGVDVPEGSTKAEIIALLDEAGIEADPTPEGDQASAPHDKHAPKKEGPRHNKHAPK